MLNFVGGRSEGIAPLYQRLSHLFGWVAFAWDEKREATQSSGYKSDCVVRWKASPRAVDADTNVILVMARCHWTNLAK